LLDAAWQALRSGDLAKHHGLVLLISEALYDIREEQEKQNQWLSTAQEIWRDELIKMGSALWMKFGTPRKTL